MGETNVSNDIRTLRFLNGEMTQEQLAKKVGVTRQTIGAIEKEAYAPSLELAFRIAHVFDKPLEQVFSYEAEMDPIFQDEIKQKEDEEE
jgi:putative transcriptional regulator